MKYELSDQEVGVILQVLDAVNIPGSQAEVIVSLKSNIKIQYAESQKDNKEGSSKGSSGGSN